MRTVPGAASRNVELSAPPRQGGSDGLCRNIHLQKVNQVEFVIRRVLRSPRSESTGSVVRTIRSSSRELRPNGRHIRGRKGQANHACAEARSGLNSAPLVSRYFLLSG